MSREVMMWLQTLELSSYPKNIRRDFSNGYLVAEIFSHYYPRDVLLHSYDKGVSFSAKQNNWNLLQQFIQKRNLHIMKETIDGTMHCKPGAAEQLLQEVYNLLNDQSGARVRHESDFDDLEYQRLLPSLARSTASKAIKINLTATEIMAEPDISTNQRKAQTILGRHKKLKAAERALNFAESSHLLRKAYTNDYSDTSSDSISSYLPQFGEHPIPFKEIKVKQPAKGYLIIKGN